MCCGLWHTRWLDPESDVGMGVPSQIVKSKPAPLVAQSGSGSAQ
jgi:hypothetical protein